MKRQLWLTGILDLVDHGVEVKPLDVLNLRLEVEDRVGDVPNPGSHAPRSLSHQVHAVQHIVNFITQICTNKYTLLNLQTKSPEGYHTT